MIFNLNFMHFPLWAVGPDIYAKGETVPIFSCSNPQLAADLAYRLNVGEIATWRMGIPTIVAFYNPDRPEQEIKT